MIKSINFLNYRNLNGKYIFNNNIDIIIGRNNEGKTNLLDGIRLAFSCITSEYFKLQKSDFNNSDDSNNIIIDVELENDIIPSLSFINSFIYKAFEDLEKNGNLKQGNGIYEYNKFSIHI